MHALSIPRTRPTSRNENKAGVFSDVVRYLRPVPRAPEAEACLALGSSQQVGAVGGPAQPAHRRQLCTARAFMADAARLMALQPQLRSGPRLCGMSALGASRPCQPRGQKTQQPLVQWQRWCDASEGAWSAAGRWCQRTATRAERQQREPTMQSSEPDHCSEGQDGNQANSTPGCQTGSAAHAKTAPLLKPLPEDQWPPMPSHPPAWSCHACQTASLSILTSPAQAAPWLAAALYQHHHPQP